MHKDRAPRTMIFLAVAAFPIVPKTLYGAARLCHRQTWIIYQYQRLRPQPKPLEGGLTRYISTRGEAPTLSFCDVMLTGLARDGGLYVPETWPQLSPETIAGFFGRPYWEVAVDAFAGLDNVDLIVLFPNGRISDVQRRMMTTTGAANVHALAIEGTFDDCQAIVKGLFNHHDFRDEVSLSGVNSINWARIVAQVVYYFTSAVALGAPARRRHRSPADGVAETVRTLRAARRGAGGDPRGIRRRAGG